MRRHTRPYARMKARTKEGGNNMALDRPVHAISAADSYALTAAAHPGRRPGGDRPAALSPSRWRRQDEYVRPAPQARTG